MMGNTTPLFCNQAILSFCKHYLGGYAQLYGAIVGVDNSLEEVGNDGERSTFLQQSNISFLKQYLGGYTQLNEPLMGLAMASKRSAMVSGDTPLFCNNQAT